MPAPPNYESLEFRSGIGFDTHPLAQGRKLVLGGVQIPHDRGLSGHSDGDVLVHAVMDALLGAANLGDKGLHFPSNDPQYEGISSLILLERVGVLIAKAGWRLSNVDATILAERPILNPFIDQMAQNLGVSLGIGRRLVNLKAKTTDGLGFIGRGEGIAALAVATLEPAE